MDAVAAAAGQDGLAWLAFVLGVAGVVRGFAGFGTALIYAPVAGIFLTPPEVILTLTLTGMGSVAVLLPRAWAEAERRDVAILGLGAVLLVPVGVALLTVLDRETVRWIVTLVGIGTLTALLVGWRWRGRVAPPALAAIGGSVGVIGGSTGLTGPPVILFYLGAEGRPARTIRANTILFLAIVDVAMTLGLLTAGHVTAPALWLGAILTPPYVAATWVGARLFREGREALYRRVAYGAIAAALLAGLPLWT